ncbi:MAG: hypothetical protein RDV48_27465 [Candidatus Eremiobacteraeota bacterium]|nr:hypothetical protein [Candidatus Eremiobacteraeota bacterium]
MDLGLTQQQKTTLAQKIQMGITLSSCVELSGAGFAELLRAVEGSEIFQKLSSPGEKRVIEVVPVKRYFPLVQGSREDSKKEASSSSAEDQENHADAVDLESLAEKVSAAVDIKLLYTVKTMGIERFSYYFIDGEGTDTELAHLLGISSSEVRALRDLFDRALIADSLGIQSATSLYDADVERAEIIAEVSFIGREPQIFFAYDRIRYRIDEKKLWNLTEQGLISPEEVKEFKAVRARLALINFRFNLLHEIIKEAVEAQKAYLISFKTADLNVLEEKNIALRIQADPSWVCRLIQGRSSKRYVKSRNRLVALRDLFISTKQLRKKRGLSYMKAVLADESDRGSKRDGRFTDEDIQLRLRERFSFTISRRAINNWRRELQ